MGRTVGLILEPEEQAEIFVCPECGKEYKTKDGLEKHIAEKHTTKQDNE